MEEIVEEFEAEVDDLRQEMRAGRLAGTDGEIAWDRAEQLVADYRGKIEAEDRPSRGRELLDRFREEIARL